MKKILLFGLLVLMVTFAGCGKKDAAVSGKEVAQEAGAGNIEIKATDYVKLGEYKGLKLTAIDTTVTDEDVDSEMEMLRNNEAELVEVADRDTVKEGDTANIDYKGIKDGVAFDGGTAEGYDLEIGSGTFIPGFEDGLVGAKVGETVNLDVTFPENYQAADLAGQPVVFEVKVNSIKEKVLPEVTDEFIKEKTNGENSSVEEYKAGLKQALEIERTQKADIQIKNEALTLVYENSEIIKDIPQEYIDVKANYLKQKAENDAKMYNVDIETYVTQAIGVSLEDFDNMCSEYAVDISKESLVNQAIAETENITVTDDELNEKITEYAAQYGYESGEEFKKASDMAQFKEYLLTDKVAQFLIDNAQIVSE